MPASDLFKDTADADFRLRNTYLVIGNNYYQVCAVKNIDTYSMSIKKTALILQNSRGILVEALLSRLPLSAMYAAPSGYFDGGWITRGPARHKYQGLTKDSFWLIRPDLSVNPYYCDMHLPKLFNKLLSQPRRRAKGARAKGVLTRDIFIGQDKTVYSRGEAIGLYSGKNRLELFSPVTSQTEELLTNARLKIV